MLSCDVVDLNDVTDKQQRHFALISIKVPKTQDVKTPLK